MEEGTTWRLDTVFPGSDAGIYQLSSGSGGKTLLQRFAAKAQNRQAALMLLSTLDKMRKIGIGRSIEIGMIRRLQDDVVEVKVSGTVVRALSYQKSGEDVLVLLKVTRGHQGSGNLNREIALARKQSSIVRELIDGMQGGADAQL